MLIRSLKEAELKTLPIIWQRLVSSAGTTCPRCNSTELEIRRAFKRLEYALEPLGMEPALEVRELDQAKFESNPTESNRIWIAGKPMEDWLEGRAGRSQCCNECGDNECRTVEVGGETYEVIPEQLLVRAGLIAATSMLDPTNPDKSHENQ